MSPKLSYILFIPLLFLVIFPGPAFSHKVIVFAWVENGTIQVEAGFGGKRPAKDCRLTAIDAENKLIYQGKTDDQGLDHFPLPQGISAPLTITLEAGPGHKGQWILEKEDLLVNDQTDPEVPDKKRPSQNPSAGRIAGGIALIFGIALLIQQLKKRRS